MVDRTPGLTDSALLQARSLEPGIAPELWGQIEVVVRRVVGLRDELLYRDYYVVAREQVSED